MRFSKVFVAAGQSNKVGNHVVTNAYSSLVNCWMIGEDGYTRPFSEPAFDPTNECTGAVTHNNPDTPGQSSMGAFFAQLRVLGDTDTLVCVAAAVGSTSALNWASGQSDSPPTYSNLWGAMRHQLLEAMSFPNPLLGGFMLNQGEADAQTNSTLANAWDTTWGANFDAFLALATTMGWTWAKTTRFWIEALQLGSALSFASIVNARQFALAAARTDTHCLQEPDASPADLHLWAPQQIALGTTVANDWFAAS